MCKPKVIITFCLLFISFQIFSQQIEGVLSKEEMYKEYDYLTDLMQNANPHLQIYKKVMNLDIISEMKELRQNIDTINSLSSYYILLNRVLDLIPEIHTRLLRYKDLKTNSDWYRATYPQYYDSLTLANYQKIFESLSNFEKSSRTAFWGLSIPVRKISENYVNLSQVNVQNKKTKDSVIIEHGWELLKINNITIDTFIKYNWRYYFEKNRWDKRSKQFYNDDILENISLAGKTINLEFLDTTSGQIHDIEYKKDSTYIHIFNNSFKEQLGKRDNYKNIKNKILYFDKVLYIKIISMNMDSFPAFKDELIKYRNYRINKLIVDIRDNPGGSDDFWMNLLSLITDKKLCINHKLGITTWDKIQKYTYLKVVGLPVYFDKLLNKEYNLIDDEDCMEIIPDSNSIQYSGKIYLLHNKYTYSAAGSFLTFALGNDKVIAVGENTGFLGGYGVDPFLFQLPYSKLLFIMHSVINFPAKPNYIDDYLWNNTEFEVHPTLDYFTIMYEYQDLDIYDENFLKNHDVYFQKVLKLK